MTTNHIFHITSKNEWSAAQANGSYVTSSLPKEGFIHCSLAHQVLGVANFKYKGRVDLVLLEIDERKVTAQVKHEDLYNLNEDYPHIYGPINLDAVMGVHPFTPNSDGLFEMHPPLGPSTASK
jgi:uncharacterized protein (DUF952 family)